jgi:hypothetical protein
MDLNNAYQDVGNVVNGNISFGTPSDPGSANVEGFWYTGVTPSSANTEFAVTHNLGRVPTGFLVFSVDQAGILYRSVTTWTEQQIFLKSNVSSMNVVVFIT